MLGIKTWDRGASQEAHRAGRSGRRSRSPAGWPSASRPIWIRFVLVPGLTDDMEDLAKTAEFAAGLGNVERVEVLPFHQMGAYKWERLGLEYTLKDTQQPTPELCEQACEVFRRAGLKAY